jgi:uncharacterized protein YhbP (UPF0306 family)
MVAGEQAELRARVAEYLRAHHTDNAPHAAHVFYAVDDQLRLVFLSKKTSLHGQYLGRQAPVAVTVSEDYHEWRLIQGVQLWGTARLLTKAAEVGALAHYFIRFPFAREILSDPSSAARLRDMGVYRVEPHRVAFTDNTSVGVARRAARAAGHGDPGKMLMGLTV